VDWLWLAVWVVSAVLEADELAELLAVCEAELSFGAGSTLLVPPYESPPPLMETGAFAFTRFCLAYASEPAH